MAGSINKVVLVGNLGRDPEARETSNGKTLCRFSLATSDRWTASSTCARAQRFMSRGALKAERMSRGANSGMLSRKMWSF